MATATPLPELTLPNDIALCHELLQQLHTAHAQLRRDCDALRQQLDTLLRRLYGPKSEKLPPGQLTLFADPEPDAAPPPTVEPEPPVEPTPPTQRRPRRRRPAAHLPRRRQEHDLTDVEKLCPCCTQPRVRIGEAVSEQLDYQPASLFVVQHVRFTYACRRCAAPTTDRTVTDVPRPTTAPPMATETPLLEATAPTTIDERIVPPSIGSVIVTAPKAPQPFDKGLPGAGLLAYIVISKYVDHLPLYRLERIFARQGVDIARSTMCSWLQHTAELLRPLYQVLRREVVQSRVLQTDETRLPVQDTPQKTKSGRLWIYVGDRDHPYLLYDYRPDKSRAGPDDILGNYKGYLQADAANVFDGLYLPGAVTEVGCWAHARRHFHQALDSDVLRAAEGIARIRQLYLVEEKATAELTKQTLQGEAADAVRYRYRQAESLPLLSAMHAWLLNLQRDVLPKSVLGGAVACVLRHWQALLRYTEQGFLNIDNNAAERALRVVAVGRKNYLFVGNDRAGDTTGILYTIAQSAQHHQLDLFTYLQDVLTRIPTFPTEQLPTLLPDRWAVAQRHNATS